MTLENISEGITTLNTSLVVFILLMVLVVLGIMCLIYFFLQRDIQNSKDELKDYIDRVNYDHEEVKKLNKENAKLRNDLYFYKELDNKNIVKILNLEQKLKELKKFGKVVEKNGKKD